LWPTASSCGSPFLGLANRLILLGATLPHHHRRIPAFAAKIESKSQHILLSSEQPGFHQCISVEPCIVIGAKSFIMKLKEMVEEETFRKDNKERYSSLTIRELEILKPLAQGHNNPTIAEQLFISRRTVEQHRKNINRKLFIRSHTDITMYQKAFNLQ